ncbi:MAG: Plug domain-containing protein [Proteobacteria bacterium]|nr:Plug domain-containing protein [Pseudomonadota bacterium]
MQNNYRAAAKSAAMTITSHRSLAAAIGMILAAAPAAHAQNASPAKSEMLEEITVTAQRRSQSVQDIPYNISVVGADELTRTGTTSINTLSHLVPGLTSVDAGPAARGNTNDLTLRGLRTDGPGGAGNNGSDVPAQTVNSVSTYFGETPVFFPIALHDIDRIEVLRGPQGTLYGSGAQAGTIHCHRQQDTGRQRLRQRQHRRRAEHAHQRSTGAAAGRGR